jgi:DNA repair protein RecO (recombination protein O)
MQLVSSESIILRSQDYLERDRLVTFLAKDAGKLRGVVKGSRKLTSRGVGDFEPFARGVMYYTDAGRGGLVTIRKCDPKPPYLYLAGDYHKFLYAGYFAELMDLIPIEPGGAEPYFELLAGSLEWLCEPGPARRLPLLRLRFELHYLRLLGYLPDWALCCVCGKALLRELEGRLEAAAPGTHAFDVWRGGVRCPDCAVEDPRRLPLAPATLAFLHNWLRGAEGARPTRQNLEELEAAVSQHLVHHLERQPRSLALLPSLDALEAGPIPPPEPLPPTA